MRKGTRGVLILAILLMVRTLELDAQTISPDLLAPSINGPAMPRVRSEEPRFAALIAEAAEWSPTIRRLVDAVEASDGIVYIAPGRCGKSVRACMIHSVTMAGPNRVLRIVIDPRDRDCVVAGSIGHELWHALEVLRERSLTSDAAVFHFYARAGRHTPQNGDPVAPVETKGALQAGSAAQADLRRAAKEGLGPCA